MYETADSQDLNQKKEVSASLKLLHNTNLLEISIS